MNSNFRKTALLLGACSLLAWSYAQPRLKRKLGELRGFVQQTKTVKGTVSDAMGPVIGATVMEKGTTNGAVTDFDGNFSLNVKPGATSLARDSR